MDRREMLRLAGLGLIGAGLGACSTGPPRLTLPRVHASWGRVIRTSVGLRPYRPRGIRLETERVGARTIVHNYGHGGAGISLSWGTGRLAASEAVKTGETSVAVIGAGAVGLATARELQRLGCRVTIYTRAVWPDPSITSAHAPARFTPGSAIVDSSHRTPEFDAFYERAAAISYRYWHDLVGKGYGVSWKYGYSPEEEPRSEARSQAPSLTGVGEEVELGPGEHPFPTPYARRRAILVMDTPVLLRAMMRDFLAWGGDVVIRTFDGPDSVLALSEPVVMNCSGLGAAEVWDDDGMEPLKGQLTMLLPQPEVDFVIRGGGFSMVPRSDSLMLGGAGNSPNDWSMEPDRAAEQLVVERARQLFENLRGAPPRPQGLAVSPSDPPPPRSVRFRADDLAAASIDRLPS